jgi:hypothetical protein
MEPHLRLNSQDFLSSYLKLNHNVLWPLTRWVCYNWVYANMADIPKGLCTWTQQPSVICVVKCRWCRPTFQRCVLYAPLKRRSTSMRLHGTLSQKTIIFILAAVKTLNLAVRKWSKLGIRWSNFKKNRKGGSSFGQCTVNNLHKSCVGIGVV